jgi:hypothetical protein
VVDPFVLCKDPAPWAVKGPRVMLWRNLLVLSDGLAVVVVGRFE